MLRRRREAPATIEHRLPLLMPDIVLATAYVVFAMLCCQNATPDMLTLFSSPLSSIAFAASDCRLNMPRFDFFITRHIFLYAPLDGAMIFCRFHAIAACHARFAMPLALR